MKFVCEQCKTKYSIADDKVRRKVLKIRCKNCSHIIVVRETASSDREAPLVPLRDRPRSRPLDQAFDGAFGKRRGKRPSSAVDPLPSLHGPGGRLEPALVDDFEPEPTRLSQAPDFLDLEGAQPTEDDWYLAVDGNQYGPMAFTELCSRIKRGETGNEAFVWRESFDDWIDLHDVPELQPYIPRHPPPPPRGRSGLYQMPATTPVRGAPSLLPGQAPQLAQAPLQQLPVAPHVPELRAGRSSTSDLQAVGMAPVQPGPPQGAPAVPPYSMPPQPQPQAQQVGRRAPTYQELAPVPPALQQPIPADSDLRPIPAPPASAEAGLGIPPAMFGPPAAARTPTWMIIAGIGGGLAALCGLFLVGYSLFVDRPKKAEHHAAVASNNNIGHEIEPSSPQTPAAAADLGGIEFPPMEVERSKTQGRPVRHVVRAPAARTTTPPKGRGLTAEQERLKRLYGKAGPSGDAPENMVKPSARAVSGRPVRPAELLALQRKNASALKACYERALKRDETLSELKAIVTVNVGDNGYVRKVQIEVGNNPELSSCVARSIRRWVFPAVGEQTIEFPVIFRGS